VAVQGSSNSIIFGAVLKRLNMINFQCVYFIRIENCEKQREKNSRDYERRMLTNRTCSLILMMVDGNVRFTVWTCVCAICPTRKKVLN
jgi:hypothetical protein